MSAYSSAFVFRVCVGEKTDLVFDAVDHLPNLVGCDRAAEAIVSCLFVASLRTLVTPPKGWPLVPMTDAMVDSLRLTPHLAVLGTC